MGHRVLRLHTSHDDLEFKCFDKEAYDAVVAAIESGRKAPSSTEARTPPEQSPLEKLKQLGELKVAGIISDAEFEAKKADLLKQV